MPLEGRGFSPAVKPSRSRHQRRPRSRAPVFRCHPDKARSAPRDLLQPPSPVAPQHNITIRRNVPVSERVPRSAYLSRAGGFVEALSFHGFVAAVFRPPSSRDSRANRLGGLIRRFPLS